MDAALTFRPLTFADLPMLYQWMICPHWVEWWGAPEPWETFVPSYTAWITDTHKGQPYIAWMAGRPLGYIQSYIATACGDGWWEDETDPGVRGVDLAIAQAADMNRGLGTAMVKAFADMLFADAQVTRIQTDPAPHNTRAIRCYEKAGFRRVGEVRTPDGPALLMVCDRPSLRA